MRQIHLYKSSTITRSLGKVRLEILVANLATNFQDLVAKVKNLVALAPVLGAILRPARTPGCLGQRSLVRTCSVAGYIDHVIPWRISFPFVLGSAGHFLRFPWCFSFLRAVRCRCRRLHDLPLLFFCLFLRRFGPHATQHSEQHLGFARLIRSHVVFE